MGKQTSIFHCGASAITIAVAVSSIAPAAFAQATSTPAAKPAASDEIVITGSHLLTSFNSPTPVNVVGADKMKELVIPQVADALNEMPSFRATTTPGSDLFRVSGAIAENAVDLRGLNVQRTLTLVDGHRFVPAGDNGAVDLNAIPSSLVQRTEIVTGGASAAYGADAMAGVVNLILDTKFTGIRTDFSTGVSDERDDVNYHASVAFGGDFAGGRGHIIAGVEYQDDNGVGRCEHRDWCAKFTNYVANPGYIGGVSTNGLPATLELNHVNFVYNPTGILLSAKTAAGTTLLQQVGQTATTQLPAALQGLSFNQGATALVPFQFGNYLSGGFMQGGDQSATGDWGFGDVPLVVPTWHASFLTHATFDVTDNIQAFGEFLYSRTHGGNVASDYIEESPNLVASGATANPYVPSSVIAQVAAVNTQRAAQGLSPITSLNVNVVLPQSGDSAVAHSDASVYRFVGGLKGTLWFSDWGWDVTYEHGETDNLTTVGNQRLAAFDSSIQAVTPAVGYTGPIFQTSTGAPVICASSVANPANGCVPFNYLGGNAITSQIRSIYFGTEWQTRTIQQDDITGNVHGTLFNEWAGPIRAAAGFEYRHDGDSGSTDPQTLAGLFASSQTTPLPMISRDVEEFYIEGNIPLISDQPFVKSFSIDLTGRYTNYSAFGSAEPWKAGLTYRVSDEILIRAAQSSDIREPTPQESNPNVTQIFLPLTDPFSPGGGQHLINNITGGNSHLNLESANTTTFGFALTPHFLPGFEMSADYYDITVKDAIDTVTGAQIISACQLQNLLCNLITWSGAAKASSIVATLSNYQNLDFLHDQGWEMKAGYTVPNVYQGVVHFDVDANYVLDLKTVGGTGLVTQYAGQTGNPGSLTTIFGVPTYKVNAVINYTRSIWSATVQLRYIPSGIYDPTKVGPGQPGYNINLANSQSSNTVDSAFYVDLSGSVKLPVSLWGSQNMVLYGAIQNANNQQMPPQERLFGNPLIFDPIGRSFKIGLRSNW